MKVLVKVPGQNTEIRDVKNDLQTLQEIVGGYIETYTLATDTVIICNEEGKLLGLPYNCTIYGQEFVGTIVFAGVTGDQFGDVNKELLDIEKQMFGG